MNQSNWELEAQSDLGYGDLFDIFWRRRFWFLGVFCTVLAICVPLALAKKPLFQSYMQILVEPNYQGKSRTQLDQDFADTTVEVDYATQLKLLKSSEILRRAVDKLGIEGSEEEKTQIVQLLKGSLKVFQVTEEGSQSKGGTQTKIIQTVYVGETPNQTKKILEAIQEVYLKYNLEQQAQRLQNGLNFINNQIPEARKNLINAEAALTELSKKHSLISPEQEAIALKENIREISQEREALKAQRSQTTGNYTALEQNLGLSTENSVTLSRLSQSTRYQKLLNELQEIEIRIANEQTRFTKDNPIIQDLIDKRDSQRGLLIKEAQRVLGKIPDNFLLESFQQQGQFVDSDTKFIDQITQSQAELIGIRERELSLARTEDQLKQKLVEFPELIAQYRNLAQEAEVKREALQRLLEAKQELEIELSRGGFNWQVIEQPQLGVQIAPNLTKDLLLSVVVASFLGGAAAFVTEAMDERVSNTKEIERQTALPILGTTPSLSLPTANPFKAQIPFLANSTSSSTSIKDVIQWQPFREALDIIYENVKLFSSNSSLKSLAITSATAGEGKSTFILGLALSVARHKQKVLVIDADLRCSSLHKAFNIDKQSGLANYLAGETDRPRIKKVSFLGESIDVIPCGTAPPDPVKLLSSSKLDILVNQHKHNYDLILIDTPPAIGMVDAIKIASICDGTVLMMRLDKVKTYELIEATGLLSKLNVLGIVANDSKDMTQTYESQSKYLLPQQI